MVSRKRVQSFSKKYRVVAARQSFQIFRQNTWFPVWKNIFGRGLYCVEPSQLICKAIWLASFYMVKDFAGSIFEQTIA